MNNIQSSMFILICGVVLAACDNSGILNPDTSNSRISSIHYDLDNNGTVDAKAAISYNSHGRPSVWEYSYIGNNMPATLTAIKGLHGDKNETINFAYGMDGKLEQYTKNTPNDTIRRTVFNFEWNENNLLTLNVNDYFNADGGLIKRNISDLNYQNNQLKEWYELQENYINPEISKAKATLTYDSENQVSSTLYQLDDGQSNLKSLNWDQGRTTSSITTTKQRRKANNYAYSSNGKRLETRTITDGSTTQVHTLIYDNNQRLSEIRYDHDNNGIIDAVEKLIWEEGRCKSVLGWFGFNREEPLLSKSSAPYLNGTGYGLINFCNTAGHVQTTIVTTPAIDNPNNEPEKRISITQSVDGKSHIYRVRGLICTTTSKDCNADYADKVFAHINKNDVPFSDEDLGSGNKILIKGIPRPFGNQPIYHSEDIKNRTSVNITLKGHNFHPGDVTHRVHFENGKLYYDMTGTGSGWAPEFNNWIGIKLFGPGVQDTVNKFGM